MTAPWRLRDCTVDDLEATVALDQVSSTTGQTPAFSLADVVAALAARHPAVAAFAGEQMVGSAVSRVDGDRAWVLRLALHPDWRGRGLGSALLSALEHQLLSVGVRRLSALLPAAETGAAAFDNNGFRARPHLTLYDKTETGAPHLVGLLAELGGSVPAAGLWNQVAGMVREKTLIERRIVLPLSRPELAQQHGVDPPRAVVLFGPPGTGKTTFARAVASRLGWPFVELFPSRLAAEDGGLAAGIGAVFTQIAALDHVVVFIDEVEEIAARRSTSGTVVAVVNELLKALVSFRDRPGRLLVCATNSIRDLDPAFLRHGRFDYVLPVGLPDETARAAIWRSLLTDPTLPLEPLVTASAGFTPADITHAARTVAQQIFECSVDTGTPCQGTLADYLHVIAGVRPTVTTDMVDDFHHDIDDMARL